MFKKLLGAAKQVLDDANLNNDQMLAEAAISLSIVQGIGVSERAKETLDAFVAACQKKKFTFCLTTAHELNYV